MTDKNPISPHIQIYNWHISSLVSISHRITGIINFFTVTLIGIWVASLLLGEENYVFTNFFLSSLVGKFVCLGIITRSTIHSTTIITHSTQTIRLLSFELLIGFCQYRIPNSTKS